MNEGEKKKDKDRMENCVEAATLKVKKEVLIKVSRIEILEEKTKKAIGCGKEQEVGYKRAKYS